MADDKVKAAPKPAAGSPGDPTDHSIGGGRAAAAAAAAEEAAEVDNTIVGKLRRSGLYFVRDHSTGLDYVGISPQNDPKATDASKLRSSVVALDMHPPRTGMQVKPESGDSFSVADGFGPDATVEDWAKVLTPAGEPLFA